MSRTFLSSLVVAAAAVIGTVALPVQTAQAAPSTTPANVTQTKYPMVLVHGFMGFDDSLGVDYFSRIPDDLRSNGATVYVAAVSQVNSAEARGEQLLQQMRAWAARDGVQKFNLIGHSQGGPTSRYVAGVAPELVASITTVGSPARMAPSDADNPVNDLINNYSKAVSFFGSFVAWISGNKQLPQDVEGIKDFGREVNAFAVRFPAGVPSTYCGTDSKEFESGMYLYSFTGNQPKTNRWDISDAFHAVMSAPSDGIITVCAARFGKVIREDLPWNHIDEMNHVFGLLAKGAPDPVAFYRNHVNRLKLKGL